MFRLHAAAFFRVQLNKTNWFFLTMTPEPATRDYPFKNYIILLPEHQMVVEVRKESVTNVQVSIDNDKTMHIRT